ncbi:MAG: RluA family pseudouridine synthase [Alphaproteobacteria bacterium]|nr:RluA family pseudouridine synthase [Alphaproteobacteria bacterium]
MTRLAVEGRLDVAVAEAFPELSRSRAAGLIREGRVTLDGRVVTRPSERCAAGAELDVDLPPPRPVSTVAQDLPLRVVYQDEHLAVVDKDAGMVVHPSAGHEDGTLVNALLHHLDDLSGIGGEERPGIVHRLDRGTSGLLVVAKTDAAHRALQEQFTTHEAGRVYLAVVHDPPRTDAGTERSWLARHPRDRLRQASTTEDRGRMAVTHWEVLHRAGTVGVVRCRLETGRTHQVRVHLSERGSPIVGDATYARKGTSRVPASLKGLVDPSGERPFLHAWRLSLRHPADGRPMSFTAPAPADLQAVFDALGFLPPRA